MIFLLPHVFYSTSLLGYFISEHLSTNFTNAKHKLQKCVVTFLYFTIGWHFMIYIFRKNTLKTLSSIAQLRCCCSDKQMHIILLHSLYYPCIVSNNMYGLGFHFPLTFRLACSAKTPLIFLSTLHHTSICS